MPWIWLGFDAGQPGRLAEMTLLMRGLLNRLMPKRFRRDDKGVTAIEFAIVGPIFFMGLFTIMETGLMMFTEYVLQTSVQEAARIVRTGQAQEQRLSPSLFKARICDIASLVMDCNGSLNVYMRAEPNFTALASSVPSYLSIGPADEADSSTPSHDCGAPSEAVALIATYDWDFTVPFFMKFLGNRNGDNTRRMVGFAMFKNEPFPVQAANVCPPNG
jgi:hypothetical protein